MEKKNMKIVLKKNLFFSWLYILNTLNNNTYVWSFYDQQNGLRISNSYDWHVNIKRF